MKIIIKLILACLIGLYLSQFPQAFTVAENSDINVTEEDITKTANEGAIRDTAKLITVRLYAVDREGWEKTELHTISDSGSGVIVAKKEIERRQGNPLYLYLVLTNNHVSEDNNDFYIQTHDGLIHHGFVHPSVIFEKGELSKVDLSLLGFYSPYSYETAVFPEYTPPFLPVDSSNFKEGSELWVGGFPCELTAVPMNCPGDFVLTSGTGYKIDKPLKDGYQLAFTNATREGSSGGAILNNQNKLIGINGKGRNDQSSPQNQYADGSGIPREIQENEPLALGIPIEYYLQLDSQNLLDSFEELIPPKINSLNVNSIDKFLRVIPEEISSNEITSNSESDNNSDFLTFLSNQLIYIVIIAFLLILMLMFIHLFKNKEQLVAEFWYEFNKDTNSIEKIIFNINPVSEYKGYRRNNSKDSNPEIVDIRLHNYPDKKFIKIHKINCLIQLYIPPFFDKDSISLKPEVVALPNDRNFQIKTNENRDKYYIFKKRNSKKVEINFRLKDKTISRNMKRSQ
ncbi:MAG: serine protease [Crocosphaera sp.]|nr:serine protease [Crocosphaera sp.]